MNKKNYIGKVLALGDTANYLLEELRQLSGYPSSIECFRVLCHRHKIDYAKGSRKNTWKLGQLADTGYNFKRKTLLQIKKDMGYAGGMYGLLGLLKRKGLTYKKTKFIVPLDLTERIAALGATDDMTPMEIFKKIKIDVQNPSQQLKKRGIVYKKRTRRTT